MLGIRLRRADERQRPLARAHADVLVGEERDGALRTRRDVGTLRLVVEDGEAREVEREEARLVREAPDRAATVVGLAARADVRRREDQQDRESRRPPHRAPQL